MDRLFLKNSFSMYILTITKMVIPFVTLPYLTRVLSVEIYGIVAYIKSIMGYVQLIIDFGFMFSVTKDIAEAKKWDNWEKISSITCTATLTRIFLGCLALVLVGCIAFSTPILRQHLLFVSLYFISSFLTIFWLDFLFRGLEKMEILSYRFLLSKVLATVLIFILIDSDKDIILMGLIEIAGSLMAAVFTFYEVLKLKISFIIPKVLSCWEILYHSFLYFISNFATTAFGLLITFLVGIYLDAREVAYWSLALQLVGGIQTFYSPILDSLYPAMIRDFRMKLFLRVLYMIMPIICVGCVIIYNFGSDILVIIAGNKYIQSAQLLICLIPMLIISFPAMLFGWPLLGALGKVKFVTISTIVASVSQIVMLFVLIVTNNFNLYYICITRGISEFILLVVRVFFSVTSYRERDKNTIKIKS